MPSLLSQSLLAAVVLTLACSAGVPRSLGGSRANVLLVVVCSLRQDHLSHEGYARPTTPFLDRLAAEGTSFSHAISASSWTKPASASLMSGLTANVHQLVTGGHTIEQIASKEVEPQRVLSDRVVTIAETLTDSGYQTAAWINNVNAGGFFNLTQGFELAVTEHRLPTESMVDRLDAWLERRDRERPFFGYLMTLDAHTPYAPSHDWYLRFDRSGQSVPVDEYRRYREGVSRQVGELARGDEVIPEDLQERFIDLYDAGVAEVDHHLSRLPEVLERHDLSDSTLVVVTSDHGEHLFDQRRSGRNRVGHGLTLDEAVIRVPLILWGAGSPVGLRSDSVVQTIDLFPTLAEIADTDVPAEVQGRSLLPLLEGDEQWIEAPAYASLGGFMYVGHDGRFKLERLGDDIELRDLEEDPEELRDVAAQYPDVARRLAAFVQATREREAELATTLGSRAERELSPEMIDRLRSLGYLQD